MAPPSPSRPPASERDFVAFIDELNASWVRAAQRLSPRVLSDLYERASEELCDFVEGLRDDAPARVGHQQGAIVNPTSRAGIADDLAWRLSFNALQPAEAETTLHLGGDAGLARHLLGVRSVIV